MKKLIFIVSLMVTINVYSQESVELTHIFKSIENYNGSRYPDSLFWGFHIKQFSSVNEKSILSQQEQYQQFISELNQITNSELSRQEYISKQIKLLKLNHYSSEIKYKMFMIPFYSEGGFYNMIAYALNSLPFKSIQDYEDYLFWLPGYVEWLEDYLRLAQKGVDLGIVAPKSIVMINIKLLEPWILDDFRKHPLYKPFKDLPNQWEAKVVDELFQRAEIIITNKIIPFYKSLDNFLRTDYLSAAPNDPGVKYLTGGKEYYEHLVRYNTTLPITPDSVHLLGLQEVARIKSQMNKIIKEIGFKGSFEEFLTFLRTDEQFYAKTPQELLNRAAWLSKKSEAQLPKLFKKLYSLPFTVAPVPEDIAPTYTGGRYVPGSWEKKRAGTYWVNTYKLDSRPFYTLPSLTLHEAVPGHHLQTSLAKELTGLPEFRKNNYINAFGEGWGLYSEYLGEEMEMYTTPYELFGRLTYEMWRACRLVVDTGIHYKGWSRESAVDYLQSNTALSLHEVNTEIDRYIGDPGQAVSYKIGELKIKELRRRAEKQLGEKFDIREFHFHILKNGSVPLPILEEEIESYIESTLGNN